MWKKVKLEDVCELITCGVAKRPNYVDTGIPFLSKEIFSPALGVIIFLYFITYF